MHTRKPMTDPAALDSSKLWDEILKAIVRTMPSQLFSLFKEAYGRDYPKDTSIILLSTETSSFQENNKVPPSSTLMDIVLLVGGTDYYHVECQIKNEQEMVIRMFAYDVRFAITHAKTMNENTGEVTLYFPRSVVIYPEKNEAIPDHLQCRVVFQDNSEHIYKIPTVKIQTYSLEEIHRKHLILFIPYAILRLRPKLARGRKHPLTEKELTEFVKEAIFVLKEELSDEYLTEREYQDYMNLFHFAASRVLANHPQMQEEVNRMTEPLIVLPSMIWDEMDAEIAEREAKIADQDAKIADQAAKIADQAARLADKDAEIQRLQELISRLSPCNPTP